MPFGRTSREDIFKSSHMKSSDAVWEEIVRMYSRVKIVLSCRGMSLVFRDVLLFLAVSFEF